MTQISVSDASNVDGMKQELDVAQLQLAQDATFDQSSSTQLKMLEIDFATFEERFGNKIMNKTWTNEEFKDIDRLLSSMVSSLYSHSLEEPKNLHK